MSQVRLKCFERHTYISPSNKEYTPSQGHKFFLAPHISPLKKQSTPHPTWGAALLENELAAANMLGWSELPAAEGLLRAVGTRNAGLVRAASRTSSVPSCGVLHNPLPWRIKTNFAAQSVILTLTGGMIDMAAVHIDVTNVTALYFRYHQM